MKPAINQTLYNESKALSKLLTRYSVKEVSYASLITACNDLRKQAQDSNQDTSLELIQLLDNILLTI